MRNDVNYRYKNMCKEFDDAFQYVNLIQMVEFPTWSRIVNKILCESVLDHIYVTDPTVCGGVHSIKPCFGDHLLVSTMILINKQKIATTFRRDWRK